MLAGSLRPLHRLGPHLKRAATSERDTAPRAGCSETEHTDTLMSLRTKPGNKLQRITGEIREATGRATSNPSTPAHRAARPPGVLRACAEQGCSRRFATAGTRTSCGARRTGGGFRDWCGWSGWRYICLPAMSYRGVGVSTIGTFGVRRPGYAADAVGARQRKGMQS